MGMIDENIFVETGGDGMELYSGMGVIYVRVQVSTLLGLRWIS